MAIFPTRKQLPGFTFENYYNTLKEVVDTYTTVDPLISPSYDPITKSYVSDAAYYEAIKKQYGTKDEPEIVTQLKNFFIGNNIGPITREYNTILRKQIAVKYPELNPPILNPSTEDTRIKEQYLTIEEQKKTLGEESFNLYEKYWKAYQDWRKITPKLKERTTPGEKEYIQALVFGRRNANLFSSYTAPSVNFSATQINTQTIAQQKQNQQQQNSVNLTKNIL
jgi:hypothetical protein